MAANLQQDLVRDLRAVLYLLWGGVLLVLLIGVVNIANLVMVRASARNRELATRHAIGASLTRLRGHEIRMDLVSVGVALLLTLCVGLLIGLVPVVRLGRMNVNATLREEGRGGTVSRGTNLAAAWSGHSADRARVRLLLVAAGLLVSSFDKVLRIDPGFSPEGVITASVSFPTGGYADDTALRVASGRILEAARTIAGVEQAGITSSIPFGDDFSDSVIFAEGHDETW
ncbi:MAG: hypothetical protein IPL75_13430 [Acidobacteria bacterium]|nr:hypothetical protein [Acidobacteriota bacterium]